MSYIEKVLWSIAKTSFSKKAFCYLLIGLTSLTVRTHIDAVIAFLLNTPYWYLNFLIHIAVSSFLIINSKYFYDIVQRYEPEFYSLVRYLINNYTEQNLKKWKRKFNIAICVYAYILTFILDLSNNSIRMIIIEYMICYLLLEMYEKYTNGYFKNQSKEFEFTNDQNIKIELKEKEKENYDSELFDIKKSI
jgi:hypothetical protein